MKCDLSANYCKTKQRCCKCDPKSILALPQCLSNQTRNKYLRAYWSLWLCDIPCHLEIKFYTSWNIPEFFLPYEHCLCTCTGILFLCYLFMYLRVNFVVSGSTGALQVCRLPRPRQNNTHGDTRRRSLLKVRPAPDGRERADVSHRQELCSERRGTETGGRHRGRALF